MEYLLCAEVLRVVCPSPSRMTRLAHILEHLFSLTPLDRRNRERGMELRIHDSHEGDVSGELVFDAESLSVIRTARGYHLRSRGAFLALDLSSGRAAGSLSDALLDSPEDQRGLFLFAFLLLLSGRGLYGLHAGGVVWDGCGFLLTGGSGSGKTTLTCALARSGWQYLADDSVLLKRGPSGLEALAFGRLFHCAPAMFRHFPELACGEKPLACGKRLLDVGPLYPGRFRSAVRPRVILFPEIADTRRSRIVPLSGTETLVRLIGGGAGFLNDRESMAGQMAVLGDLSRSARGFVLMHGADVHSDPSRVSALLRQLANKGDCIDGLYTAA